MQATRRVDEVVEKEQVSIAPISSGGRRGHSFQTDNIFIFFSEKKSKAIWKARAPFVQIGAWPVQSHFRRLGRVPAAVDNISTRFIH